MIESEVKNLLKQLAAGEKNVDEVMLKLKMEPFENLGFAKPDFHRRSAERYSISAQIAV